MTDKKDVEKPQAVSITSACAVPADLAGLACAAGEKKARQNYFKMFVSAVAAGMYIGVGGMVSVALAKGIPSADAGMQKFAFGAVFPVGLVLVVLLGAELVTGNFAVLFFSFLNRRIRLWELLLAWVIVYFGNFLGSLAVAYFLGFLTDLFASEPYLTAVQAMAESKVNKDFGPLVLLGVGCNWLVCLAVVLAMGARDVMSKIAAIWFPIQTFVTIGFEHCVANMSLVPIGLLYGADITFGEFIVRNLVPVTIGNILGAVLLVSLMEWFLFGIDTSVWNLNLIGQCCHGNKKDDEKEVEKDDEHAVEEGRGAAYEAKDEEEEEDDEEEHAGGEIRNGAGPLGFQKLNSTDELEAKREKKSRKSKKNLHKHHSTRSSSKHRMSSGSGKKESKDGDVELKETAA